MAQQTLIKDLQVIINPIYIMVPLQTYQEVTQCASSMTMPIQAFLNSPDEKKFLHFFKLRLSGEQKITEWMTSPLLVTRSRMLLASFKLREFTPLPFNIATWSVIRAIKGETTNNVDVPNNYHSICQQNMVKNEKQGFFHSQLEPQRKHVSQEYNF